MRFFNFFLIVSISFFTMPAMAYYALLDNGEVMEQGKFKATGDVQVLTEDGNLNLGGRFDAGFNEEIGVRGIVGFGDTDYFLGALVKWMPVPDVDRQPAIGGNAGILYAKDGDITDMTFRVEPMLSKKIPVESVVLTPYAGIPVGLRLRNSDNAKIKDGTDLTFQLVGGMQLQLEQWKNLQFIGEIGLDLNNAPGYLSAGAIFYFDSENGFSLE